MGNKVFKFILVIFLAVTLSPTPVHAQDGEAIMRGIFGAITQGMEEQKRQKQPQQEPHPQSRQQSSYNSNPDFVERRQNRKIQTALKQLNFYDGVVDGILGAGTVAAIKAYEKDFEHLPDGVLNEDELHMLFTVTDAGFTSHEEFMIAMDSGFMSKAEYDQASAGGFISKVDYFSAQKGGFTNKAEYDDAQIKGFSMRSEYLAFQNSGFNDSSTFKAAKDAGFSRLDEYDTAHAAGFSTKAAFTAHQITTVQNLISDLEAFLPRYEGEVDIAKISKILKQLNSVSKGQWSDNLFTPAEDLKDYAHSLSGFKKLQKQKDGERRVVMEKRKAGLLADIEGIRKFSDQFLRKNLMNSRAVALAEGVDQQEDTTAEMSENELQKIHSTMQGLINDNRLSGEYRAWKTPPPTPVKAVTTSGNASVPAHSSGMPRVQTPVETKKFRIVIDSIQKRKQLGDGMFMDERASNGTVYIVVSYTVTNISRKPVSSWSFPSFYLRDRDDTKYNADTGGNMAYAVQSNQSEKSWSKLNPDVSMSGAEVFHVSEELFDPNTWTIEVDADKDFRVILY